LLLTFRAGDPKMSPVNKSALKLTGRRTVIAAHECIEVTTPTKADAQHSLWVDASRDFVVVRMIATSRGVVRWKLDIDCARNDRVGWVPQAWTISHLHRDGALLYTAKAAVKDFEINPNIPANEFDISFPVGAVVVDERNHTQSIQKPDGELRPIAGSEMRMPYEQLLNSPPPSRFSLWKKAVAIVGGIFLVVSAVFLLKLRQKRSRAA
jgi:hypothetical protein